MTPKSFRFVQERSIKIIIQNVTADLQLYLDGALWFPLIAMYPSHEPQHHRRYLLVLCGLQVDLTPQKGVSSCGYSKKIRISTNTPHGQVKSNSHWSDIYSTKSKSDWQLITFQNQHNFSDKTTYSTSFGCKS